MQLRQETRSTFLRRLPRTMFVLAVTIVVMWLTIAITMALTVSSISPATALSWWPSSADAKAAIAAGILEERPGPADVNRVTALATEALRREPLNVVAARTLGLAATMSGDQQRAERFLTYAEALSRRDLPTLLWAIERNVQRNDIVGALQNYDRALRTSPESFDLLMPILVQASGGEAIARPLADLLVTRPPWWRSLAGRLVAGGPSLDNLAYIVRRLRLDPADDQDRELLSSVVVRLARGGKFAEAFQLYRQAKRNGPAAEALLRSWETPEASSIPPFDWTLHEEPGLAAVVEARPDASGQSALYLTFGNGQSGELASQTLLLQPGNYRLTAEVGDVSGGDQERPIIALSCAGPAPTSIATLRLPNAPSAGRPLEVRFAVPAAGCPAQQLTIVAGSTFDTQSVRPWISRLQLRRG